MTDETAHDKDCEGWTEQTPAGAALTRCACQLRADVDRVLVLIRNELLRATARFGPFASAHEGFAVIREELDELWDEVKANCPDKAVAEAIQVAAMGARFVLDIDPATGVGRSEL